MLPPYAADSGALPAPTGTKSPADANLLDARPALAAAPPAATHELYLELGALTDGVGGRTRGAINGASYEPKADGAGGLVPMLWRYMDFGTADGGALRTVAADFPTAARGSAAAAAAAGAAPVGAPPQKAIFYDAATSHYLVPRGAAVLAFVNNTHARERTLRADGHAFFVLSTSELPGAEAAHEGNWLRRDAVSVPARGWARLLFVADNPGVWRLTSGGAWHVANGESVELFEAIDGIEGLDVPPSDRDACGMPEARLPAATAAVGGVAAAAAAPLVLRAGQLIAAVLVPVVFATLGAAFFARGYGARCTAACCGHGGVGVAAGGAKVLPA